MNSVYTNLPGFILELFTLEADCKSWWILEHGLLSNYQFNFMSLFRQKSVVAHDCTLMEISKLTGFPAAALARWVLF